MTADQQDPIITPRIELRQQWRMHAPPYQLGHAIREDWLINRASGWGYKQRGEVNEAELQQARDQELEACCEWLRYEYGYGEELARRLCAARRPKPSLKKQACDALDAYIYGNPDHNDKQNTYNTIRRALEALPE